VPKTPKRAGRAPHPEAKFPSQVVAANIKSLRALRDDMSQEELADRMRHLRFPWSRATVSEIERGDRNLTVDEFASLAIALNAKPTELLDPERQGVAMDFGMTGPLNRINAIAWARGGMRVGVVVDEQGQWQYAFERTSNLLEYLSPQEQER
jgi:transcriptional regulator with XRE-family HTH domain